MLTVLDLWCYWHQRLNCRFIVQYRNRQMSWWHSFSSCSCKRVSVSITTFWNASFCVETPLCYTCVLLLMKPVTRVNLWCTEHWNKVQDVKIQVGLKPLHVFVVWQKKKKKVRKVPAEVEREYYPSTTMPPGTHTHTQFNISFCY